MVDVKDRSGGRKQRLSARFAFLGAGGGALPLLQKSGIPEGRGFGGFPVSGLWLRCDVPALANRHNAKVYGKASVGQIVRTPPVESRNTDVPFAPKPCSASPSAAFNRGIVISVTGISPAGSGGNRRGLPAAIGSG